MNLRIMVPKGRSFDNDGATIYARRGGGLAARGTLTARSSTISNAQALDHLKIQRLMSSYNARRSTVRVQCQEHPQERHRTRDRRSG